MNTLNAIINYMKQFSNKWDHLTPETITKADCLLLENELNERIDNGSVEITDQIEHYQVYLELIRWNQIKIGGLTNVKTTQATIHP